ncbi:MAG: helix-turn-helix transcriptional regulator, partial [Planctomycetota bacterium]
MLSIVTTLQSGAAWTPARLATHFGTSERTIYRDLDRFRGAGVPVAFDRDTGRYRIDGAFYMPPVRLTADETDALVALTGHLEGERAAGPPCP